MFALRTAALLLLVTVLRAAALPTNVQAEAARRKLDAIHKGKLPKGSTVLFSTSEVNSYTRAEAPLYAPDGFRQPRLELGNGTATGYALVDFLKLRHGQETNWLVSKLISGERPVKVTGRIDSSRGTATVLLQRVEISGLSVSGPTLDFLIKNFLNAIFPEAKVNQPFALHDNVERITVRPDGVRVALRR